MKNQSKSRLGQYALSGLLVGALVVLLTQQTAVADWFRLRGYQPTADISAIASETTMTDDGRHLFYINRPTLEDKSNFQTSCPNEREKSVILGCYHPVQRGIAVLRVDDARLDGVEEVTAAHEMLHAAYDRMSGKERKRVDGLIADFARTGLKDERIKETLDSYSEEERPNEMHSIFGTEVAELPAELERHYSRYFARRDQVVAQASRYTAAFTSRKAEIAQYDAQLQATREQVKRLSSELEERESRLEDSRSELDAYQASGNTEDYNEAVPGYNVQVQEYNTQVAAIKVSIARYNRLVEQRNAVALEEQDLQHQLDSSYQPTR